MRAHRVSRAKGFTLVELLVVIGIIALLISILLPSLQKARRQAKLIQCASNLRQVGIAAGIYTNQNKGAILPTIVWGGGGKDDSWAHLLVVTGLVSDPRISAGTEGGGNGSILVCPEVRELMATTNVPGLTSGGSSTSTDGYERRVSNHLQPGLIIDFGYGINGYTAVGSTTPGTDAGYTVPSTSISNDAGALFVRPKQMSSIPRSSDMIFMYDGVAWNPFNALERMSGSRHGKFDGSSTARFNTGQTNLLFLDGHVVTEQRASLPSKNTEWYGTAAQKRTPGAYLTSTNQLN